jgi:hypothetical protein
MKGKEEDITMPLASAVTENEIATLAEGNYPLADIDDHFQATVVRALKPYIEPRRA